MEVTRMIQHIKNTIDRLNKEALKQNLIISDLAMLLILHTYFEFIPYGLMRRVHWQSYFVALKIEDKFLCNQQFLNEKEVIETTGDCGYPLTVYKLIPSIISQVEYFKTIYVDTRLIRILLSL